MKKVTIVLQSCRNCPHLTRNETTSDSKGQVAVCYTCRLTGGAVSSFVARWKKLEFTIESGKNMQYLQNDIPSFCPLKDHNPRDKVAISSDEYALQAQKPTCVDIDISLLKNQQ